MKVTKYAIVSSRGFETFADEVSMRKQMKALHVENVPFIPKVFVEGIPSRKKSNDWLNLNEYTKLLKKEENSDESKDNQKG